MTDQRNDEIPSMRFLLSAFVSFESFALSQRVANCEDVEHGGACARILLSIYIKLTFLIFIMLSSRGKIEITTPL